MMLSECQQCITAEDIQVHVQLRTVCWQSPAESLFPISQTVQVITAITVAPQSIKTADY